MTLETLLNKLIELGRKPRGKEGQGDRGYFIPGDEMFFRTGEVYQYKSLNDLCSLDSGLRQFVCEKGLYEEDESSGIITTDGYGAHHRGEYKYFIIQSSIQEDIPRFLLDNISLGQKKTESIKR